MKYVNQIVINGKVYYSIPDLTKFEMHPDKEAVKKNPNIIDVNGSLYLDLEADIPEEKPPELNEFDKILKGVLDVPKPKS